jgi:hypothetical protein
MFLKGLMQSPAARVIALIAFSDKNVVSLF